MPESKDTLKNLRMQLEKRLTTWIPDNNDLVSKELQIFDSMMSRRSFLKTTSAATLTMMLGPGCGGAPSDYDDVIDSDFENGVISESAKASVTTPSNIAVDSDIHSSFVSHNPLPAYLSKDSNHVKDHAVLESFNPHIMTTDVTDELFRIGFNAPERTYGIPEHVHLSKDSDYSDYYLAIYEKSHDAQHGLAETKIPLRGTAGMDFNSLIATNGTFHNKVLGNTAYGQKLALLANISTVGININDTSRLRLYYQTNESELLEPSVEASDYYDWNYIDVVDEFKNSESLPFKYYNILDANAYKDGHHNSFIYGTLSFDSYYYYGFVVNFNEITDKKPSITFFTPEFLSYKSDTIQTLKNLFTDISYEYETNYTLADFSIFSAKSFQPLAQDVSSDGRSLKNIYFTFSTMDVRNNDVFIQNNYGSYDLSDLIDNNYVAKYLVHVDTTKRIDYLLSGYEPVNVDLFVDSYDYLSFVFDNSSIPAVDLWEKLYDRNETLIFDNFVRSIKKIGTSFEVILASAYYNESYAQMGLVHKSISIQARAASVYTSHTLFEDGKYLDIRNHETGYKELWHEEMKSHLGGYESLYETVFKNYGIQSVQFHCTQNHQGLLRSYYIITNGADSLLIGFNEKGQENENTLSFQNHENLKYQIQNNSVEHYPPMPVAINAKNLHRWYGIVEDGEVLFTGMRRHKTDYTSKKLVENDDTDLLSYKHSCCNLTQKNWNTNEEKRHVESTSDTNLVSADLHQVHLHVTNIYRHPVSLPKSKDNNEKIKNDMFVEVRFNKRLRITDHTDPNKPKTYHPGANSSLFLSTDKSGRISLEVEAGNKNDKYNGAQMQYRLVNKSEIYLQNNRPLASFKSVSGNTTSFKACNISFRIFQRLSIDHYDKPEVGVQRPGNKTLKDGLNEAINYSGAISKIADGYGKLSKASHISPENSTALVSLSEYDIYLLNFTSSITHFHPASWIKHAANSVLDSARKALAAAKQAVDKLAHSIDDAITNIENDVVTAIEDIAMAVEKSWKEAVSLAEKLWDYLMALLDLETAYDIGQELIQIRYDQLKPIYDSNSKNNEQYNIFNILESTENFAIQITDKLKSKATNIVNDIYNNQVFHINDITLKLDSHRSSSKKDQQTQQNNSTKITHIVDQLSRLKKILHIGDLETYTKNKAFELKNDINNLMFDLFNITLDDMFSGTFPAYLESSVLEFFKVDSKDELLAALRYYPGISPGSDPAPDSLIRKIQNNTVEIKDHMQTFASGATNAADIASKIEKNFRSTSLLAVDRIDEMVEAAIKMPTEFLKDDKIEKFMTSSGPLLDKFLKPLGLLLFMDGSKFKNIEDTAAFAAGFGINMAPLMADSAFNEVSGAYSKSRGKELDLSLFITDGTFRNQLNDFIDLSRQIIVPLTSKVLTKKNIKKVATEIAEIMAVIADKVLFKLIDLLVDLVGLIVEGLEKIMGLISKIPIVKDAVADALGAVLHVFSGMVQILKTQAAIIDIGISIFEYMKTNLVSIEDIVIMAIQAVSDTIGYILNLAIKICEAGKMIGKGQPGEVVLYDPLRVALLSFAGFFIAGLSAFVMDVVSMGFKFTNMGYDLYKNGLSHLIKDAAVGVTVVLELATVFFSFLHLNVFLFSEMIGYIIKSIDIELIIAGFETIALPAAYAAVWILYLATLAIETVLGGVNSVSSITAKVSAFAESEI